MTKFKIYKLRFIAPLHIGDERADYSSSLQTIHSDTLYSAMISVLAKTGSDIPEKGDLGFAISSLFPYYQENEKSDAVYFLPKLKAQSIPDKKLQDIAKKIKKVEWLDIAYFNKLISGERLFSENFNEEHLTGKYLSEAEIEDFIIKEVNPRVKVSRDFSKDAEPFYMERLYFKGHSGMYFIAEGDTSKIDLALNILKNEGIGTDRTVGNGYFEWSEGSIDLQLGESGYISNLSMFIPENKEQLKSLLDSEKIAYDFTKRGGWITDSGLNTFRKNSIYMFKEASVFATESNVSKVDIKGKIVDLKPKLDYANLKVSPHPIWRSGKAIFIPVKI